MAKWIIAEKKFKDLIDQVLYNRGVIKKADKEAKLDFLEPDFKKLHDPFLMPNLKKAIDRISLAKKKNETVGIFADYDADGIPGVALLYKALSKINLKTYVYIPNRESGYGLCKEGIDFLASKKCTLIITVDLGIRNFEESIYCREKGIDLIITDHHTPDIQTPDAYLIINPKVDKNKYPFSELSGSGVAYKLIQGLSSVYTHELDEAFLKWNLDLVAISTISDMVPLIGENRILASFGLFVLRKTKNIGIEALCKAAKINQKHIDAYGVGFQIGPRINAPGRIESATKSFELLVTNDKKEAKELADWLEEKNRLRQETMNRVEKEAMAKIEKEKLFINKLLIVSGNWIKGVTGPTASRLVQKYSRPVILFAKDKDTYTGSARSVEGVNILEIVAKSKKNILKFGGHRGACGITVIKEKFDLFSKLILKIANKEISDTSLEKSIRVDTEVDFKELKLSFFDKLKQLEPFGMGNARPVFCLRKVEIDKMRKIGAEKKHLSFYIKKNNSLLKAIYFNGGGSEESMKDHKYYDFVFSVDKDTWQGNNQLKLIIFDVKKYG